MKMMLGIAPFGTTAWEGLSHIGWAGDRTRKNMVEFGELRGQRFYGS
jgi:hypothetical protein